MSQVGRYAFHCSVGGCREVIVVPGMNQDDAATFLLEETTWAARVSVDESHLLCPRHAADKEGRESESVATDERHVCEWSMPSSTARGSLHRPYTCWCKEDPTGRLWRLLDRGLIQVDHCPNCGAPAPNCEPPQDPRNRLGEDSYVVHAGTHIETDDHPFALTSFLQNRSNRVEMGLVDTSIESVEQLCARVENNGINKNTFKGVGAATISKLEDLVEQFRNSQ